MATVFRRDEIDRVNENATNIIQQQIVPNKPKILTQERIYVYVPKATSTTPGIAAFRGRDFNVIESVVRFQRSIMISFLRISAAKVL